MKSNNDIAKAGSPLRNHASPVALGAVSIAVFAVVLGMLMTSIGSLDMTVKKAPAAPEYLVSAGAPRSQLELKRMFESMSLAYTEGGLDIYEPINQEYRCAVASRVEKGERLALSVEEILYIISDTVAAFEKYDVIRLRSADGSTERAVVATPVTEDTASPFHRMSAERLRSISYVIEYRITSLSSPDAMVTESDGSRRYTPRSATKEEVGQNPFFGFMLTDSSPEIEKAVVFVPEEGERVTLFPTAEYLSPCRSKVILNSPMPVSESEAELLKAHGIDPRSARNITPVYWYPLTKTRIFADGGKVLLADPDSGEVIAILPEGHKLISLAVRSDESGTEIYFSSSKDDASSVFTYSSEDGKITLVHTSENELLAVIENGYDGYDRVAVCSAVRREDGRFVTAVECVGEPLLVYAK